MSDDDQTQTDVEPDPSIGIAAILESIQGSLTALALTSLRSTLKKAPQQLSPLLVVLDKLSPPPILPPASVVPVKRDFRDELGVVTPIGFFDPIGKVSQIHTTPSSNHIVITQCHHIDMALSINQSSTYLYRLHINYRLCALPRVPRRRAEARPGRYGGLPGIPRPGDRPTARLGGR